MRKYLIKIQECVENWLSTEEYLISWQSGLNARFSNEWSGSSEQNNGGIYEQ